MYLELVLNEQKGIHYKGETLNNLPHGFGTKIGKSGIIYEGSFEYGKYHGRGKRFYSTGFGDICYSVGDYVNGELKGRVEFFAYNEKLLGYELYGDNSKLLESNIDYLNGKRYQRGSFILDENEKIYAILCNCGEYSETFECTDKGGWFSSEKYKVECGGCNKTHRNIPFGSVL